MAKKQGKFTNAYRKLLTVGLVVLVFGAVFFQPAAAMKKDSKSETGKQADIQQYVPGQLIVKFKKEPVSGQERKFLKDYKIKSSEKIIKGHESKANAKANKTMKDRGVDRLYLIELEEGSDAIAAVEQLKNDPDVEYAEPNGIVEIAETFPNDPSFSKLWGLHNTGQTDGIVDADIDAPGAWDIQTGSSYAVIAVIDTGVDYNHPDLAANIWTNPDEIAGNGIDDDGNGFIDDVRGWDFVNDDNNPMDDHNHGTHCSGTIGAAGNDGVGVAGVNWDVSIMPIKFLSAGGSGSWADAIAAVEYATLMGADISSNSWGGSGYSQGLYDAISAAGDAGILFVAAAGNNYDDSDQYPAYPASYDLDNIVSVAATDHNDDKASFSNWGLVSVDLGAPGVAIYSTLRNGTYGTYSGTSMATPHTAGAAGLIKAQYPDLTSEGLKARLLGGVDIIPSMDGMTVSGGRLNIYNSLEDDDTAPDAVTDLQVTGADYNSVSLSWTATGDDGSAGTAKTYDLRYSTSAITAENWDEAARAQGEPIAQAPGSAETFMVENLAFDTEFYFALKVLDNVGNVSGLSNVVSESTVLDAIPPAAVSDLSVSGATYNAVSLAWTAPGDDGSEGGAARYYDVRFSLNPITSENWSAASQTWGEPLPQAPGSTENFEVKYYLAFNTSYYFAMKTTDKVGSVSELSNVVVGATVLDDVPPSAISDLAAKAVSNAVSLSWTATGDDGIIGTAKLYDIRYSTYPITAENWNQAAQAQGETVPKAPGLAESFVIRSLSFNSAYYFAIKSTDKVGNFSDLSNIASAATMTDPKIVFSDNMENGAGGWTHGGAGDNWNIIVYPYKQSKAWVTGNGYSGYAPNANFYLTSPSFDLSSVESSNLKFTHSYVNQPGFDGGIVEISGDGGSSWAQITPLGGYPSVLSAANPLGAVPAYSGFYNYNEEAVFDISDYDGEGNVKIRFRFGSDATIYYYLGWTIDNVAVIGESSNNSLSAYWTLNEGAGSVANDSTANANNGTISGASWTDGKIGKALSFDGINDYVNVPDSESLNITNEITVMAWVNETSTGSFKKIVSKRLGYTNYFYFIGSDQGKLYAGIGNGATYGTTNKSTTLGTGWHHAAFTFNNADKTIKLYKDGINVENKTISQSLVSFTAPTRLGSDVGYNHFKGNIDNAKVYSRALSGEEIAEKYNSLPLAPKNLTAVPYYSTMSLKWYPPVSNSNLGIIKYNIYRNGVSVGSISALSYYDYFYYYDYGLTNGITYAYQIAAVNSMGEGEKSAVVYATPLDSSDKLSPQIAITSPENGQVLGSPEITVTGTTSDPVSLPTIVTKVEVRLNGGEFRLAEGITDWSIPLTLSYGENLITAKATDGGGNTKEASVIATYTPADDYKLAAYWTLNEGAGSVANDSTANANNGTISGASWTDGKIGKALSFDGINDYVNVPDSESLNITNEITVMAWVNETSTGSFKKIVSKRLGYTNYFYFIGSDQGKLYAGIGNGAIGTTNKSTTLGTGWHHAAFTFNNTDKTIKLYKDGINVENKTISQSLVSFTAPTRLGSDVGYNHFKGNIDNAKVYSRVLDPAEILDEYNAALLMR